MWYTDQHASTIICSTPRRRRASRLGSGSPIGRWLHRAPLPDAARQCRGPVYHCNRPQLTLQRSDSAQRHPRLREARPRGAAAQIVAAAHLPSGVRRAPLRSTAGTLAPESAPVRQGHQHLDTRTGGRGRLCPGHHPTQGQRRNHSHRAQAAGRVLETGQALDYLSRPRLCQEKKRRDRLIRLACNHPEWALGFADEVWWSRLAQPDQHRWTDDDTVVRLQELERAKDDPDPKALACYGVLLRRRPQQADQMLLRFVEGRPLSAVTTDFLAWCCERLAAQGVSGWFLIW